MWVSQNARIFGKNWYCYYEFNNEQTHSNRMLSEKDFERHVCHMPKYIKKKILKNLNSSSGQNNCVKSIISHLWQFLLLRKTICNKKT